MAATYGSAVQIRAWTNPSYAPNKKYDVIPYKAGSPVTADQQLGISLDDAEILFQQLLSAATVNPLRYDQIEIKEQLIVVPS